jgi:hypothetical protein
MRTINPDSLTKLMQEVNKKKGLLGAFPRKKNHYLISAKQSGDYIKAILDIEKDKEERRLRVISSYNDDDNLDDDDWEEWAVQNWITVLNGWKPDFEPYLNDLRNEQKDFY